MSLTHAWVVVVALSCAAPMFAEAACPPAAELPTVPAVFSAAERAAGYAEGDLKAAQKLNSEGFRARKAKKGAKALELYRQAVAASPGYAVARSNLACELVLAGKRDEALAELTTLFRLDTPEARDKVRAAQRDEDLRSVWEDPALCAMVADLDRRAPSEPAGGATTTASAATRADLVATLAIKPTGEGEELGIEASGFPAVSRDRRWVALFVVDADSARGNPNGSVQVVDAKTGKIATQKVILSPDEADEISPALRKTVAERIEKSRALIAGYDWVTLDAFAEPGDHEDAFVGPLTLGDDATGVRVTFKEPRLVVTIAGEAVHEKTHKRWSAPTQRSEDGTCENPATLLGGFIDPTRRVLLIHLGYRGNDTCWEPTDQMRVVRLP